MNGLYLPVIREEYYTFTAYDGNGNRLHDIEDKIVSDMRQARNDMYDSGKVEFNVTDKTKEELIQLRQGFDC